MSRASMVRCVAMLLAVVGVVGCGGSDDRTALLREMAAQHQVWRQSTPARYVLAINFDCFCSPSGARSVVDSGRVIESAPPGWDPVTVDWLFAQVQSMLARGFASASVEYDPVLGYPTSFQIDPDRNSIDEEFGFHVTCFASGDAPCPSETSDAGPP